MSTSDVAGFESAEEKAARETQDFANKISILTERANQLGKSLDADKVKITAFTDGANHFTAAMISASQGANRLDNALGLLKSISGAATGFIGAYVNILRLQTSQYDQQVTTIKRNLDVQYKFAQQNLVLYSSQVDLISATNEAAEANAILGIAVESGNAANISAAESTALLANTQVSAAAQTVDFNKAVIVGKALQKDNADIASATGEVWTNYGGIIDGVTGGILGMIGAATLIGKVFPAAGGAISSVDGVLSRAMGGLSDALFGGGAATEELATAASTATPELEGVAEGAGIAAEGSSAFAEAATGIGIPLAVGTAAVIAYQTNFMGFRDAVNQVGGDVISAWGNMGNAAQALAHGDWAGATVDMIKSVQDLGKAVSDAGNDIGGFLRNVFKGAENLGREFGNTLKGLSSAGAATTTGTLGTVANVFPGLQEGGYIASEGLAYLHPGETVIPSGMGGGGMISAPMTISITVNSNADIATLQKQIEQGVSRALQRALTTKGGF